MKSIIKNLLIKYSSCENMFKHFHHCSFKNELFQVQGKKFWKLQKFCPLETRWRMMAGEKEKERRAFWEVLLWTFSFPNRGRIFLHEQLVSREDFWFQDQEQQPADNEKIPVQKIRILNLNLNTIIIRLYTPIWCRYHF